jgi:hypothetical protein
MTLENINEVLIKLDFIIEDLMMIRDGEEYPDEKFCNAIIQRAEDIINIIENE